MKTESRQFRLCDKYRYMLYLLYIILLLPVFLSRDFTPANELKYMSIAEEALTNRTWFTFYNHGEIYADKPPLFFWLIMISKMIFGKYYIGITGLFSLVPVVGILVIMNKWLKDEKIIFYPVVSELLLLTTALFTGASLFVRMDMLMTFFIVLSLYTFFRIYRGRHKSFEQIMLPVYIFLSVFTKGAMGFIIPIVSILAFLIVKRQIKTFTRYLGWKQWSIMIALFVLWFMAVYIEGGKEYLNNLLFRQTIGRGVNSFHHKESFIYYFPRMIMTFAPWSILYIILIWQGIRKRMFNDDVRLFFAITATVNILLLSLISSKIDIYMLPLYPFIVYLSSSLLPDFIKTKATRIAIAIPAILFILAFPISFFVTGKIPYEYNSLLGAHVGLFLLFIAGLLAIVFLKREQIRKSIILLSTGLFCVLISVPFFLPQFSNVLGFKMTALNASQIAESENISQYAYYKFPKAPNMDIYLGKKMAKISSVNELDSLVNIGKKSILFVRETEIRREHEFSQWLEKHRLVWHEGRYRWYILDNVNQELKKWKIEN